MDRYLHCYLRCVLVVVALSAVCHTATVRAQDLVTRTNNVIMANGFFAPGEWDDGSLVEIGGGIVIYAKQDTCYLYIGIRTGEAVHTGLDLYIADSAERQRLLHVSSALAEAMCDNGKWSEWRWEEKRQWVANKIGLYHDGNGQCSSEPEGFEFQIHKDMIHGEVVHIALHLKRPEYVFPILQDRETFKNWIQLLIDG